MLALAVAGGATAQPVSNSLVPGIAPYAPPAPIPSQTSRTPSDQEGQSSAANVHAPDYNYVLGAGDKLRITVFEEEDLSGEFNVSGNGLISFPLIGDVPASGRTVQEVQGDITAKLRDGYVKDPRVSAEVLTFRPYYILGEVAKPGEYPYSDAMTVLNAIATAGGFTYRANHGVVFIKRANELAERKTPLTGGLTLSPGDTVRVGERLF
jgi:polysaccharide export outer membrane protein